MTAIDILRQYGLNPSDIIADSELHRCPTIKKPHSKNGWYVAHDGGRFVIYGNWEFGDDQQVWYDGAATEIDILAARVKIDEIKKRREREREQAAVDALAYLESLPDKGFSDYLKNKRVFPHKGVRFDNNVIVVPLQDASGKIWSYQKIYGNGDKYFLSGSKVSGCYFLISGNRNISKDELVIVCEGYATGATIHEQTNIPVVVAFNAGNLKAVCDSLPFRNLLIAADNDTSKVGESAAKDTGYPYVMPEIEGWDFSDVYLNGKNVTRYFVKQATTSSTLPKVGGLVGEIADWITATAIRPQPALSLAAALSFVGTMKGHRIAGSTDLRTNVLALALAPTAGGKEHPQNCLKRLAYATGLDKHLMGEPVSGAGFLAGLNKCDRVSLLIMDEIGRFIGNLTSRMAGGYQREIVDYIIKTFSCANTVLKGRQYANEKMNPTIDINQPHFCCFGSTVKEKLIQACSSSEIIDGFLNRWLVFNVDDRAPRQQPENSRDIPEQLIKNITSYMGKGVRYSNYGDPEPAVVRFTPEAWDMFTRYRDRMDRLMEVSGYPLDKLYSRACEHVEKVALILSDDEDILYSDIVAAIQIVEQSNQAIAKFAGLISDNVLEQDFIRVREKIRDKKEIGKGELTYSCQFVTGGAKRIGEIIGVLLDQNVIAERKVKNKVVYKWIG